jgi:hypothetical protein
MREVSKKIFYEKIGPLDVVLRTIGQYPYTTIFELRGGSEIGRTVDSFSVDQKWPIITQYFLKE